MKVLIADDEPLALKSLELSLSCIPEVDLVGSAKNGNEALSLIRELKPDVAIIDIEMPGRDGLTVLEGLAGNLHVPQIVFLTAFDHYAARAFDLNAVDYLTKPLRFERLKAALARAAERLAAKTSEQRFAELQLLLVSLQRGGNEIRNYDQNLWVRNSEGLVRLPVASIDMVEAQGDYVDLIVGETTYTERETISAMESKLDPASFRRCHRSFIVNLARVKRIRRNQAQKMVLNLEGGRIVSVGPSYADGVLAALKASRWR